MKLLVVLVDSKVKSLSKISPTDLEDNYFKMLSTKDYLEKMNSTISTSFLLIKVFKTLETYPAKVQFTGVLVFKN